MKLQDNIADYKLLEDPIKSFESWFSEALKYEENPRAMAVATSTKEGYPSVRYLLYKGLIDGKLPLYTNFLSTKAHDLKENPKVELSFYWHRTKRQVRIFGDVTVMPIEKAKEYFFSRDRDSQIASLISEQSQAIASREELLARFEAKKKELENKEVPFPQNWGGFLIEPKKIEFFIYNEFRLNDRFLYEKDGGQWSIKRLQP
jgi:pyridoxamine 5'-phosphate oxidase